MDYINWCKQQKKGIKIIDPNSNLCSEYFKKAQNALQAVQALHNNTEWEISACYYAMYFSLYAILMKIGIQCQIHSCTIEIAKKYLHSYFTAEQLELFEESYTARVDVQYYVDRIMSNTKKKYILSQSSTFYITCKEISSCISTHKIEAIRKHILHH